MYCGRYVLYQRLCLEKRSVEHFFNESNVDEPETAEQAGDIYAVTVKLFKRSAPPDRNSRLTYNVESDQPVRRVSTNDKANKL